MDRELEIRTLDGSNKASGTSGKHLVGKMFRMGKNRTDIKTSYVRRMGLT